MRYLKFWVIGLLGVVAGLAGAEIQLAPVFSDHMVLQRGMPVKVFGKTEPGSLIEVKFGPQTQSAQSDTGGNFRVLLKPLEASSNPESLIIRCGEDVVTIEDVLVGEVWLASGQSNMEKQMGPRRGQRPTDNYETEVALANYPNVRLFQVPLGGDVKRPELEKRWLKCSPETLSGSDFSAVAYYFSRELHGRLGVPIGIVNCSFGGTMIETWIPREFLESSEQFACKLQQHYFAWVEGVQASEQYEAMVRDLQGYSVRGFLWYQGESNLLEGEVDDYADKMELMIRAWRTLWEQPDAPFYYVQLAPFRYSTLLDREVRLTPQALPRFWESQSKARSIPNTEMICITDLAEDGRDIHPTQKREVGERLGHLALEDTYGIESINARNPEIQEVKFSENGIVEVILKNTAGGFISSDGNPICGFQLAGANDVLFPAEAVITGSDTLMIMSSLVAHPKLLRFGWHETRTSNLVNSAGLPAIPFRTDDLKIKAVHSIRNSDH
jgi:sialate O-acetylesterase